MDTVIESLRQQIVSCEVSLRDLRQQLAEAEHIRREQEQVLHQKKPLAMDPLYHDMDIGVPDNFRSEVFAVLEQQNPMPQQDNVSPKSRWPLEENEYKRYGRQLIMPEVGLKGQ